MEDPPVFALAPAPAAAADAYDEAKSRLIADVDRAMSAREDVDILVGGNPLRMMFDNHRNHAAFISTTFRTGRFELLQRTIPWVYRAYLGQGFSSDYFPIALGAWQDAVRQRMSTEHADAILPLYRWMVEHHGTWIALARERPATALIGSPGTQAWREGFFEAVRAGDPHIAAEIAEACLPSSFGLLGFFEAVVQPAMAEVGLRWEAGSLSVAQEHRATAICTRVLAGLQASASLPPATRGRALVAAAPSEYHELGAQMLAMGLEADGWTVSYLGADMPQEDLIGMAVEERPQLVGLSVSMAFNVDRAAQLIAGLRASEASECRVMVGGQALASTPELAQILDADAFPSGLREALEVARGWGLQ